MAVKRKSIWDNDYTPYGTYEGSRGSPDEWKQSFQDMFRTVDEAKVELGDENPWRVLGLNFDATLDDIKSAFRKLVLRYGPDKSEENPEKFRKVIAAYKVLTE
jgi:DnaJ-class molecular chaperone